jgi:hypothetical protein
MKNELIPFKMKVGKDTWTFLLPQPPKDVMDELTEEDEKEIDEWLEKLSNSLVK